jgi:subtilisin family serine protease
LNQTSDIDIDAPEAWDLETGSSDVVIAVIDTGIGPWSGYDTPGWSVHEDLKNKLWVNPVEDLNQNGVPDFYPSSQGGDMDGVGHNYCCRWAGGAPACYIPAHYCKDDLIGYDFYSNDNDPHSGMDSYPDEGAWTIGGSHGTPVTGVIGAETNNLVGVASLCQNCKLMILKAGNGDSIWMWPIALRYAIDHDADVISMSWGGGDDLTLHNLLIEAYNEGIVLVAAAGNSNSGVPVYPAAYPEVIGVASHKEDGVKSTLSNYGSWVDVAAPGDNVYTTKLGGGYGWSGGTSLSAPFVSSLAGLLLSSYPDFSPAQVEQVIQDSSEDKAYWQGTWSLEAGRINAFNALNEFCVFNNVSLVWNNTCVAPKPKRCVNHQVVNSCQVCGCPIASAGRHYECQGDGSCRLIGRKIKATAIEPPMG